MVFTGDAFYLRFYRLNPQLTFFTNSLSARHFKHSSSLCSPTLVERVSETTAPQDCAAVPLGSSIYFTGGQVQTKPAALFIDTTLTHNPGRLSQACKNGATTTLQSIMELGVFTSSGVLKVWGV